jgi:glycosyltransferase involved in cell wall biosynthesis
MSSLNSGLTLAMKRVDVALARHRPDHFIFQSEGMKETATHGRGIPERCTSIVRTGIDTDRFAPSPGANCYAHQQFHIPTDRRIVFFSGHMQRRKGVDVILKTAVHLVEQVKRRDVHFLILGNRDGEERAFLPIYRGTAAEGHITFGGYRHDVPELLRSCSIGMIASTGWDSFPMSSVEMAATELPLVISDLPGLRDAVTPDTGFLFPVGDHVTAAERICRLLDDERLRQQMGRMGRQRAIHDFSVDQQVAGLVAAVRSVADPLPD